MTSLSRAIGQEQRDRGFTNGRQSVIGENVTTSMTCNYGGNRSEESKARKGVQSGRIGWTSFLRSTGREHSSKLTFTECNVQTQRCETEIFPCGAAHLLSASLVLMTCVCVCISICAALWYITVYIYQYDNKGYRNLSYIALNTKSPGSEQVRFSNGGRTSNLYRIDYNWFIAPSSH